MTSMTLEWLVRTVLVTFWITVAAHAASNTARLLKLPQRWVWWTAMLLTLVAPWLGSAVPWHGWTSQWLTSLFQPVSGTHAPALLFDRAAHVIDASSVSPATSVHWFAILWVGSSLLVVAGMAAVRWRLRGARMQWRAGQMCGAPVLIAADVGPAVVGLRRPEIVVPAWVFDLTDTEQLLISAHEREHVRAGDARLLTAGMIGIAAMPWNVLLWWQFRQLRTSVETDCDARVLSHGADPRVYGTLLLKTAARCAASPALMPALGGRAPLLEQRILAMTNIPARHPVLRALSLLSAATIFGVIACDTASTPKSSVTSPPTPPTQRADVAPATAATPATSVKTISDLVSFQEAKPSGKSVQLHGGTLQLGTKSAFAPVQLNTGGPLVVIDGKAAKSSTQLDQIDPQTIKSIEVFKGKTAVDKYGAPATNGVIVVTTGLTTRADDATHKNGIVLGAFAADTVQFKESQPKSNADTTQGRHVFMAVPSTK